MNSEKLIQVVAAALLLFFAYQFFFDSPSTSHSQSEVTYSRFIDIDGDPVELSDYFANYLWVDYAAEWCSYCDQQTATLKALAREYAGDVDFLTIVTGTAKVMEAPTAATARNWRDRHNLEPDRVIARFYTDRLPYHLLYAPDGNVLFRHSGLLQRRQIEEIIKQHTGF